MSSPEERARTALVRRLEKLAPFVTSGRFLQEVGLNDLIDYQENVFGLQRDLQAAVSDAKGRVRRDKSLHPHLSTLRHYRWLSRRLGDALAWSLLLHNRRLIYALADNKPVPVPSAESDGTRGVFTIARAMTSREWGVPVVHDITNVLRVGDITFMNPQSGDPEQAIFRTFEAKTTRSGEMDEGDGTSTVSLRVQLTAVEEFPDPPAHLPPASGVSAESMDMQPPPERRRDRRLSAQLRRMDRARASRDAPLNAITKFEDNLTLNVTLSDEGEPHWKQVRRAIRSARRDGYAYFALDGFVGYAFFYNAKGIEESDLQSEALVEDLTRTLVSDGLADRNSMTVSSIPDEENDPYGHFVLPVFLWDVPQVAIRDILRNRLVIMGMYNTGQIEKLLRDEGFDTVQSGRDTRSFDFNVPIEWSTGERRIASAPAPWRDMFVAVHEFRGAKPVVRRAQSLKDIPAYATYEQFVDGSAPEAS